MSKTMIHQMNLDSSIGENQIDSGWLVQIHPLDLEQNRIPVGRYPLTIGRSNQCDIVLNHPSISRRHAKISLEPAGHRIEDMGSTNRIRINEQYQTVHSLRTGDRIQLGDRIFRYLTDDDVENQYHRLVYSMMTRDSLTSVFNKRYLMECLNRELIRCRKFKRPLSVILMDVDHFKTINDHYGHITGDDVLIEMAHRVNSVLDEDMIFARFGGEEFAIVGSEIDFEAAFQLAERCRHAIASLPLETETQSVPMTVSVGLASAVPRKNDKPKRWLIQADQCLYLAKHQGRNQVQGRQLSS